MQFTIDRKYVTGFLNYFPKAVGGLLAVGLMFIGGMYYGRSISLVNNTQPDPQVVINTPKKEVSSIVPDTNTNNTDNGSFVLTTEISGVVTAVSGQTITLDEGFGTVNVTTSSQTEFSTATLSSIATGDMILAVGTPSSDGSTLTATQVVDLSAVYGGDSSQTPPATSELNTNDNSNNTSNNSNPFAQVDPQTD
jgi:Domain of unknown function (DUF5666)